MHVCVQFFKVGEIDTLKEQYTADVIVRARWREPTLDGQLQLVSVNTPFIIRSVSRLSLSFCTNREFCFNITH